MATLEIPPYSCVSFQAKTKEQNIYTKGAGISPKKGRIYQFVFLPRESISGDIFGGKNFLIWSILETLKSMDCLPKVYSFFVPYSSQVVIYRFEVTVGLRERPETDPIGFLAGMKLLL